MTELNTIKKCPECGDEKPKILFRHSNNKPSQICAQCIADLGDRNLRWCPKCSTPQPRENYHIRSDGRGLNGICKPCASLTALESYNRDPERHQANSRNRHYVRTYGISQEDYDALFAAQDGKCACCGRTRPGRNRLSVDHDHGTGKIRGLLCNSCNSVMGRTKDNPELLFRMAAYLWRHQVPHRPA